MQPRKQLGQHWLDDEASLQSVADAAHVGPGDTVLEIGPGPGTLTSVLVERADHVIALEIDHELAQALPTTVPSPNLTVIEGDIRHADFRDLPAGYKVAGNIPYYLTSYIIQILLEAEPQPAAIGLLVQKEVAQRIAAQPGDMSILAVITQLYATVKLGPVVDRTLFYPAPTVDSQVLSIVPKKSLPLDRDWTFRVIKAGFSEKRKKLANSLQGSLRIHKADVQTVLTTLKLHQNVRAQELTVEQWQQLAAALRSVV